MMFLFFLSIFKIKRGDLNTLLFTKVFMFLDSADKNQWENEQFEIIWTIIGFSGRPKVATCINTHDKYLHSTRGFFLLPSSAPACSLVFLEISFVYLKSKGETLILSYVKRFLCFWIQQTKSMGK